MTAMHPVPAEYAALRVLARSCFGSVMLCKRQSDGMHVAVKASRKDEWDTAVENPLREVELWPEGDGFLPLLETQESKDYHWIVTPYCHDGDLMDRISARPLQASEAHPWFGTLLKTVAKLHAMGFCHTDISVENVLLPGPVLADFGMMQVIPRDGTGTEHRLRPRTKGKCNYLPPEQSAFSPFFGTKADVFALGVVLFIMLFGTPPFDAARWTDPKYKAIREGKLHKLMRHWGYSCSTKLLTLFHVVLGPEDTRPSADEFVVLYSAAAVGNDEMFAASGQCVRGVSL